jgi:hypothetical protein
MENAEGKKSPVLSMTRVVRKEMMMNAESIFWLRACIPLEFRKRMKIKVLLSLIRIYS